MITLILNAEYANWVLKACIGCKQSIHAIIDGREFIIHNTDDPHGKSFIIDTLPPVIIKRFEIPEICSIKYKGDLSRKSDDQPWKKTWKK